MRSNNNSNFAETAFVDEPPGCCEQTLDYNRLPDACTNEVREERLLERQKKSKDELDNRTWIQRFVDRERFLIIACVVLVVCLNFTEGQYILYPFMILSIWVHEMCHATAAIIVGGTVQKLQIFKDGSGLAYTSVSGTWRRGWVASGGYPGTAVTGCILLLFRRTTLRPTIGTISIGFLMMISCFVWVRNAWGFWVLLAEGIALMLLGWKLPAHFLDSLYAFFSATCCRNAVEFIRALFADGDYYVGGEVVTSSDAHTVAEMWGMDYRFWAIQWLILSFVLTAIGIKFALNAKENNFLKESNKQCVTAVRNEIIQAEVVAWAPPNSPELTYTQYAQSPAPSAPVHEEVTNPTVPYGETAAPSKAKRKWFGFRNNKKLLEPILYVSMLVCLFSPLQGLVLPSAPSKRIHFFPQSLSLSQSAFEDPVDDSSIQWELFNKHHAKGSWKGVWTTYDYLGDVIDETIASVDLHPSSDGSVVEHTHTIVVGAKRSDCTTCFDSMEQKTLPVGQYTEKNIRQRTRFAGVSMVTGPTILRSGAMATELVLRHGDGRVRVTFNHAPVWEQGVEPGSCPPQGLKLFRTMLSREALRSTAPTAETEAQHPPLQGNPIFYRSVPPFNWHKKWSGTSWTWGPQTSNRGWSIDELQETDSWHGITPVDCWNLRLGGIHLQTPRVITPDSVGICRFAWLPDNETLLRVEAGVSALQPMVVDDESMVGFEPPSLTSLRCDMLQKTGELDNAERPFRGGTLREEDTNTEVIKEVIPISRETIGSNQSVREGLRDSLSL